MLGGARTFDELNTLGAWGLNEHLSSVHKRLWRWTNSTNSGSLGRRSPRNLTWATGCSPHRSSTSGRHLSENIGHEQEWPRAPPDGRRRGALEPQPPLVPAVRRMSTAPCRCLAGAKRLLDTTTGYSRGVTRFRVVRTQCPFILFSAAPDRPSLDCSFERQIPGQWT